MTDSEASERESPDVAVSGAKFYHSIKTIIGVDGNLTDEEKREILEMVMDDEL